LVEAAEKIGIGRDTLSELERGRRHPVMPTLSKIARGYGVQVEELLDLEEEVVPQEALSEEPVHTEKSKVWLGAPPSSEMEFLRSAESQALEALLYYVEQRIRMYEKELENPNGQIFFWIDLFLLAELLKEQGVLLAGSMINEGRGRAALPLVERAKQYIEELAEVSERVEARFADKHITQDKAKRQQSFARAGGALLAMAKMAEAALQAPPYETLKDTVFWGPTSSPSSSGRGARREE